VPVGRYLFTGIIQTVYPEKNILLKCCKCPELNKKLKISALGGFVLYRQIRVCVYGLIQTVYLQLKSFRVLRFMVAGIRLSRVRVDCLLSVFGF
jgi:hypothetical protein